jgi:hypothetical protein
VDLDQISDKVIVAAFEVSVTDAIDRGKLAEELQPQGHQQKEDVFRFHRGEFLSGQENKRWYHDGSSAVIIP